MNSDTPSIDGGSTSSSTLTPDLGVSRRTLALVGAAIVVAAILWYLRSYSRSSSSSSDEPADETEEEPDRQQPDTVIRIPSNPTEELDKDEAVLEGLRQGGVLGGDD